MTVLASGSKGNSAVVASSRTRILVDAGLSCRELLRRMAITGEDPAQISAILVTHEHQDHVAGLAVLARRLRIPVFFTEPTHRAWVRMLTPRTTMTYAQWLDKLAAERERKAAATANVPTYDVSRLEAIASLSAEVATLDPRLNRRDDPDAELPIEAGCDCPDAEDGESIEGGRSSEDGRPGVKADPTYLPAVEYFRSGTNFCIGDIDICPFTIPHDAADPCGFVFTSAGIRMAIATDLGYMPPNVKSALRNVDVLLIESNHDLEMLKDGPYPWSVKQRVMSRVGHLSNLAAAEFLERDYDGGAHTIILGHLSESNNAPELARISAEQAIGDRMTLLGNRILLAHQQVPLKPVEL